MLRLNARDYAQNTAPKVLTTPGPHPLTYTPNTLTQPGLPFIFTAPYTFLLPHVQTWSPQTHAWITLSWLCNLCTRMAAFLLLQSETAEKVWQVSNPLRLPPYEHGGEQSPCLVPVLEADSHEKQGANSSVTVEVCPGV